MKKLLLLTLFILTTFFSKAQDFTFNCEKSFSYDGSLVALAAAVIDSTGKELGATLNVWETATGNEKVVFKFDKKLFQIRFAPQFSHDNKYIYFSYDTKDYKGEKSTDYGFLCNLESGKIERTDFSPLVNCEGRFGDFIVDAIPAYPSKDEIYFNYYDMFTNKKEKGYTISASKAIPSAKYTVKAKYFHMLKNGTAIILGYENYIGYLIFFNPEDKNPYKTIKIGTLSKFQLLVSPDEKFVYVPETKFLISTEEKKKVKDINLENGVHLFGFDNENRLVHVLGGSNRLTQIRKYNPITDKYELEGISRARVKAKLISPLGNYLLSITDTLMTVYDIESDAEGVPLKNSKSLPYFAKGNVKYEQVFKGGDMVNCKSCNGSGKGYSELTCTTCRGSGGKNCSTCGGKRYVYNSKGQSSYCNACSGRGKNTCYTCYGTGKKKSTSGCSTCGGSGMVKP